MLDAPSIFLSTPSARRATEAFMEISLHKTISIHALREEGDWACALWPLSKAISIHALREEGDLARPWWRPASTYFYPRPPRGGRHQYLVDMGYFEEISIHALREEGDAMGWLCTTSRSNFYPRPPRGGRPASRRQLHPDARNFYPRPPRGGRQQKQRQNLYFLINYTTFCTNLEEP